MFSNIKKLLKIFILSVLAFGMHLHADEPVATPTLCEQIATNNLLSVPLVAGASLGDVVADPYACYNFLTDAIAHPQAHDKRKRAFKILNNAEQKKAAQNPNATKPQQPLLDATTWQDLNLLSGSKDNPATYLASLLSNGRTHTEMGKAYLCGLMARPTSDRDLLVARQAFIKKLVDDEVLFNQVDTLLKEVAVSETLLTGLWDVEMLMQFINGSYSKLEGIGPMINQSPLCLDLKAAMGWSAMTLGVGVTAIAPLVLSVYGLSLLIRGEPALEKLSGYCFGSVGLIFEAIPPLKNRWAQGLIALGVGTYSALSLKETASQLHTMFLYDDFLRKRLVRVALYEEAACQMAAIVKGLDSDVAKPLAFSSDLTGFFDEQLLNDPELAMFDDLLHTDTFAKGSDEGFSAFFSRGNLLAAYYIMNTAKDKFEGLMAGLGELDAFLTIAKIVKESKVTGAQWCFPSYVTDAETPSIQLTELWNPFLDPTTAVRNSINLGVAFNVPNMIVTGPNSAGKSTTLKSIVLSVILAQSLGIAPAQAMVLTPFAYMTTYMNVSDSVVDKESRFQVEARRVFEYGDKLEELAVNKKFSLGSFDEIFSGTSPAEGAKLGLRVAEILSRYSNCISIIATHFEELTTLAQQSDRFVNFKVGVDQNRDGSIRFDEQGRIARSFTITPGIAHQHIACEVFKEKGEMSKSMFFNKHFAQPVAG